MIRNGRLDMARTQNILRKTCHDTVDTLFSDIMLNVTYYILSFTLSADDARHTIIVLNVFLPLFNMKFVACILTMLQVVAHSSKLNTLHNVNTVEYRACERQQKEKKIATRSDISGVALASSFANALKFMYNANAAPTAPWNINIAVGAR